MRKRGRKRGRSTVYNKITSKEKLAKVNIENVDLEKSFIEYLMALGRSDGTIKQYRANLHVFWIWNLEKNYNKPFVDLKKRDIIRFQNHCNKVWKWSTRRIITVKSTLSSLSNYVETILDEEYSGYKAVVSKIQSPSNVPRRTKTIFQKKHLQKLLDYLVEHEKYMEACALSLAMNSARRKSEIVKFRTSYFKKKNLICDGALYKTPEPIKTKGGKMLDVFILAKPFQPYLDMWMSERERLGVKSKWLFPRFDRYQNVYANDHITIQTMDRWAKSFSKILGQNFYWHSIRHFAATSLAESNLPESVIKDLIGWSSLEMVRLYVDTPKEVILEKYFGAGGTDNLNFTEL